MLNTQKNKSWNYEISPRGYKNTDIKQVWSPHDMPIAPFFYYFLSM